ncbi:MAG: hypothetical protein GOVbin4162_41 [Prokaryotic dsDNA virus sp.]|nr:MAG: hypothetical protein GOVbin4162_41 [Prokaryotic dsDNA virus sp.]|tara:strand:- start:3620 stop:4534 length:915 start_codon:yes stop_codon:yes gene_type:complete
MARVQVQDLNEKLELADIDFLHIKDGASGIDYKFTFSNFELPTTNPTRQTVSNLGSVAFDNLVPLVRGGTGSSTAAGARTNLGLGTAATKDYGRSLGNLVEVGSFGLGSTSDGDSLSGSIDSSSIPAGDYKVSSNSGVYPVGVSTSGVLSVIRYNGDVIVQKYAPNNSFRRFERTIEGAVVGDWREVAFAGEDITFRDIIGRNIDATGYLRGSDPSLKSRKQVVSDITREDLDSIALYYFRWKDMQEVDESIRGTEDIGVMADEVQRIFPECVTVRSNGTLAVDYAKFATCFTLADYKLRREGK